MIHHTDLTYLEKCIELAKDASEAGDEPFGSTLIARMVRC